MSGLSHLTSLSHCGCCGTKRDVYGYIYMSREFTISVPREQSDIKLHQYQKYVKLIQDNGEDMDENFLRLKVLEIFCGLTMKEAYNLPVNELDFIVAHILTLLNNRAKLERTFTMTDPKGNTVKFGFIPNLDEMTLGEFIDVERYLSSWEDMHKALSVLYRPVTAGKGDFYLIEGYQGSHKYSDVMKDAPVTVALGAMVFFYSLGMELLKITMRSLEEELQNEDPSQERNPSDENGDGINRYMHLLQETQQGLTKLHNSIFINV
jgi:hypothetical protein